MAQLDLVHRPNCGVREVRTKRGAGQVDYLLYVDRKIVGVIEAKPTGTPLSRGVAVVDVRRRPIGCPAVAVDQRRWAAAVKTLIFAKDDNLAEEIVTTIRAVFGKGNDFASKITYSVRDERDRLAKFRNSPTLRVAVTVDVIATGTDVKPLQCVFFMRDVRSATYFEQMKGRGARTIPDADFQAVTPYSKTKDRFVIVDAVGVTEHELIAAVPLSRDRSASLKQLLGKAAALQITEDEVATLAARLARLDQQLTSGEQTELPDSPASR